MNTVQINNGYNHLFSSLKNQKISNKQIKQLKNFTEEYNFKITNSRQPQNQLGKTDFLKLLSAQIRHQNPLSPTQDTQSIAQMAQFSALEQMQEVSQTMNHLLKGQKRIEALDSIGKNVLYTDIDGQVDNGKVLGIDTSSQETLLVVQKYSIEGIKQTKEKITLNQIKQINSNNN